MDYLNISTDRSGIYMIFNILNGKRYVGSSVSIYNRIHEHISNLKHNHSHNTHLQAAWNKYGDENFIASVLEYCDPEIRFIREQYYLDLLQPEYNLTTNVIGNFGHKLTEETKEKISNTLKERYQKQEIVTYKQDHTWKPVYVYNIYTGELAGEFKNATDACCAFYKNHKKKTYSYEKCIGKMFASQYIGSYTKFKSEVDKWNYIWESIPYTRITNKFLVVNNNGKIRYFINIPDCVRVTSISKGMIMKNLKATIDNPYCPTKYPGIKLYFQIGYIPVNDATLDSNI